MAVITTVETVAAYCERQPTDPQLIEAWKAAESYVLERTRWPLMDGDPAADPPVPPAPAPDALVRAVELLTARYLARRSSPDGFVGMGEFGPARVPTVDRDVEALIGPYRTVVFG